MTRPEERYHDFATGTLTRAFRPQDFAGPEAVAAEDAGMQRLWEMATSEGAPDEPVRKFALHYLRMHHPVIHEEETEQPLPEGHEIPAGWLVLARAQELVSDERDVVRKVGLDWMRQEFARWNPSMEELVALSELPYDEVHAFVELALTAEDKVEHQRYRLDPEQLTSEGVYRFCDSLDRGTRGLGMKLIALHRRLAVPEELFRLTESPDRQVRAFVVRQLWSQYRHKAASDTYVAPEREGELPPAPRPEQWPAEEGDIRAFLRRTLFGIPPGRLSKTSSSDLRRLPAREAKLALIEITRDLALEDRTFAERVAPMFTEFLDSGGPRRIPRLHGRARASAPPMGRCGRAADGDRMSTKEHWLTYRGEIRALIGVGEHLVFVTSHDEEQPTGIYRVHALDGTLQHQAMPGGLDVARGPEGELWVVGVDGRIWTGAFGGLAALPTEIEPTPTAVAPLAGRRAAVLAGPNLLILAADGTEEARFGLAARGTAIASDPTGHWIAAGSEDGTVAIFSDERPASAPADSSAGNPFVAHEQGRLHRGEVFVLRFEQDELRFRSAGDDRAFLITHARGALDSVNRGGRHGHAQPTRGIAGDGKHVFTVGEDAEIKAWRRGEKRQPATQKRGVGTAQALAEVQVDGVTHLAVAADDASIRLFPLDDDGKPSERTVRFNGAIATVRHELDQEDPERRRAALQTLAGYADAVSIELLGTRASDDGDHKLRLFATEALGALDNPRAMPALETLLYADTDTVRFAALRGLRRHAGEAELRPLNLALDAGASDIGVEAVGALRTMAAGDERAHVLLVEALSHGDKQVREAGLEALEQLHPQDAAASLWGLRSSNASLRWRALLRIFQRGFLDSVDRELRGATGDADADVRQLAYQLRLLAQPRLASTLRQADRDLHRNLHAIETHGQPPSEDLPEPAAPDGPPETLTPLLQAASSRRRDTCLRGASHLATLRDSRAFGVLLQLSREGEPDVQVRACRALQLLDDPRALGRMQAMLRSDGEQVRDAAYSAIERLLDDVPLQAAEIGLSAPHPDVRSRGLRVLIEAWSAPPSDQALALLRRALDDAEARIRNDAFKAVLRLEIDGAGEGALRFALQSLHDDVRRDVLTELMSEVRQEWAWALLLERMSDSSSALRSEAFAFARKQGKAREPDAILAALQSSYVDTRLEAVEVLSARVDDRARPLLIQALDDDDEQVRNKAFGALQRAAETEAMVRALQSRHADVRDTIAEFRATSQRADLAIIYLSGQAVHDDRGLTHLLAPDARSLNEALLLDDLVSSSRTEPTAALTLVILDASFSNDRVAALARERNLQPGIAALAPRASIIVLSAHERYDALDIEEPDGRTAFTEALLEALEAVAGRTEGASLGTLWEEVAHRAADRHDLLVPEFFGDAAHLETALFGVPEPPVASDDAFIERIQARLKETGCYVSVVDGVWGRGSNRAFAQFQAALATAAGTGPRRPIEPEWRDQVAAQRFDAALADRIEEVPPRPRLCEPPRRVTTTATGRNTARPAANGGSSGAAQRPTERPAARKEPSRPRAPDNFGTGLF